MAGASCAAVFKANAKIKFKVSSLCLFNHVAKAGDVPTSSHRRQRQVAFRDTMRLQAATAGMASCLSDLHAPHNVCKAA